jgi:hypothetical protein
MNPTGAWLAYYADWSAMAVFDDELACLRYAVEKGMQVKVVPFGVDLHEAVNR